MDKAILGVVGMHSCMDELMNRWMGPVMIILMNINTGCFAATICGINWATITNWKNKLNIIILLRMRNNDDDLDDVDEDITDEDAGKDAGFKEDRALISS